MAFHESALRSSWRDTDAVRRSLAWWLLAVASGAALAVGAYYIAPGGASVLFAFAGVVIGFLAPYVVTLIWSLLGAYGYQPTKGSIG